MISCSGCQNGHTLVNLNGGAGKADLLPTSNEDRSTCEHEYDIEKSESDRRLYRVLTLQNKLKVLLVSDFETSKASACLCVRVGSFSDPVELPGLAHFCEHMILLGSQKYPDENEYSKFVSSHNGFCNAYTSAAETSFVFDIAPEYLHEALEIFAELFITPRFTESAVEREVNAVDSEHEKNLPNDLRRLIQIDKLLASPDHDYAKFSTGNKTTLFDNPKKQSISIREELVKFHAKFYSSNLMAVTILAKESLDDMEMKYASLFMNVPNKDIEPRSWSTTPWTKEHLQKKIFMVPAKDIHELRMFWPIKDYTHFYKSEPSRYLAHLLGHESSGSLLSALKKRGFANDIITETYRPSSGFACLTLRAILTEKGISNIDDIITIVFQYLHMLKQEGIQEWIFDEERDLEALRFRFKGSEEPFDYVAKLSSRMFLYPPKDVLTASHLLSEFRPDLINEILSCLGPENLRCFVLSRKVAERCNRTEYFYGTRYGYETIPHETVEAWRNCGLNPDLHLPPRNPYMPSNFDLKCHLDPDPEDVPSGPRIVLQNSGTRLWFKQDSEYKLPKTFVSFNLISPFWTSDPVRDLMLQLFASLFYDSVNEDSYLSSLSGLYFNITAFAPTLRLTFNGYSHKMPVLVETLANQLLQFMKPDTERFSCLLKKLELQVKNFKSLPPFDQADGYCASTIFDRTWVHEDRCAAVSADPVVCSFFINFTQFFSPQEALKFNEMMTQALEKHVNWHPPVAFASPLMREVEIPTGLPHIYKSVNTGNPSSAILVYFQCSPVTVEECAMHRLFEQIIREPAFNTLRTEKQLGYIVRAGWHQSNTRQGINIIIQSKYHPRDLDEFIEEFVADLEEKLVSMQPMEYSEHVNSVVSNLLEKPKNMNQQYTQYWSQIIRRRYEFDRCKFTVGGVPSPILCGAITLVYRSVPCRTSQIILKKWLKLHVTHGRKYDVSSLRPPY
ncbi:unnamed protein product [Mesocestoides corti]|uniref:Insulin-degrading enzyme n=1 Tax=Mesocestoides corti TaxID=53468 RepID=A0A0R3UJF1_MESCO|nr:unnamed protein product [Mesocestoides corti]